MPPASTFGGRRHKHGFGYIWYAQEIGDADRFLHIFKQRLIDCAQQEWHLGVSESPKLSFYASIKHSFEIEQYLVEIP